VRIGIVADDLTGAMDAAVPFADVGLGTRVALDAEAGAALARGQTEVVSVDVHSRDSSPQEAAAAARSAMEELVRQHRVPFKKIDSTLRGNIGPETIGALLGSGRRVAIIAPAAPQLGRQLREGRLVVNGELVGSQDLVDTLRAQLPGVAVQRLRPGEAIPASGPALRLLVADAQLDSHLDHLVEVTLAMSEDALLVGSSGLATALARRTVGGGAVAPIAVPDRFRRLLFVVGSRNPRSVAQVRALLADKGAADLGVSLQDGALRLRRAPSEPLSGLGVVYVAGLEEAPLMDSQLAAAQLAEVAAALLAAGRVRDTAMFITGGDTARATLARLGVRVVAVSGSFAPGVVLGSSEVNGCRLFLVTKAGGFGDTDLLTGIATQLFDGG
jgi:uncharacterized protein YgbK (DUF1537 family)